MNDLLEIHERKLLQLAKDQSLYAGMKKNPIRITFTRYQTVHRDRNQLLFKLDARGDTYREIGILYVHVEGLFKLKETGMESRYSIGIGLPTSVIEFVFGVLWNLAIIFVGVILILSAKEFTGLEKIILYSFLPVNYGTYCLRLSYMFTKVKEAIPVIVNNWCEEGNAV